MCWIARVLAKSIQIASIGHLRPERWLHGWLCAGAHFGQFAGKNSALHGSKSSSGNPSRRLQHTFYDILVLAKFLKYLGTVVDLVVRSVYLGTCI